MKEVVSTRIDKEWVSKIDELANEENTNRSLLLERIIVAGLKQVFGEVEISQGEIVDEKDESLQILPPADWPRSADMWSNSSISLRRQILAGRRGTAQEWILMNRDNMNYIDANLEKMLKQQRQQHMVIYNWSFPIEDQMTHFFESLPNHGNISFEDLLINLEIYFDQAERRAQFQYEQHIIESNERMKKDIKKLMIKAKAMRAKLRTFGIDPRYI